MLAACGDSNSDAIITYFREDFVREGTPVCKWIMNTVLFTDI